MTTLAPPAPPAATLRSSGAPRHPRSPAAAARPVPARAVGAPSAGTPGLVLTRRGRRALRVVSWSVATVAVALGVLLLWLSLASLVAPGAVAGDGGQGVRSGAAVGAPVETTTVVVQPGDTLWEIARTHAPGRDPRSVTEQVVALNDLGSAAVQVGDSLLVPTS